MESKADFRAIGATTYLCPIPAVFIGCAKDDAWQSEGATGANLITVAWAGVCATKPPVLSISLRKTRYSHGLIAQSGEFTVNLASQTLLHALDYCGVKSGRDMDKFATLGLHPAAAGGLAIAPALLEAPAYLSCKVRQVIELGSHDLFLADIVQVHVRDEFFREDGSIDEQAMHLVAYVHGKYRALGDEIGFFGFSVAGAQAKQRRQTVVEVRPDKNKPSPRKDNKAKAVSKVHAAAISNRDVKQGGPKQPVKGKRRG